MCNMGTMPTGKKCSTSSKTQEAEPAMWGFADYGPDQNLKNGASCWPAGPTAALMHDAHWSTASPTCNGPGGPTNM